MYIAWFFHSVFLFKEDIHFGENTRHRINEVNFDLTGLGSPMRSLRRCNSKVLNAMKNLNGKSRANYMKVGNDLYTPCFLLTNCRGSNSLLGLTGVLGRKITRFYKEG